MQRVPECYIRRTGAIVRPYIKVNWGNGYGPYTEVKYYARTAERAELLGKAVNVFAIFFGTIAAETFGGELVHLDKVASSQELSLKASLQGAKK